MGIAGGLFAGLGGWGATGVFLNWENRVLLSLRDPVDAAQGIGPWWLPGLMRDLTALGSTVVLTLITVAALGVLAQRRAWGAAGLLFVSSIGGTGLLSLLKSWFARPRPTVVPPLATEISASFPSGHAMMSTVIILTIGLLLNSHAAQRRQQIYLFGFAAMTVGLIGVSRVYLGVHYPTDVAAGWAAGTAWALLCWRVSGRLRRSRGTND